MHASPATSSRHVEHLRTLTAQLAADLEKCAAGVHPAPVHHVRTGTRRLQATLDTVLRETGGGGSALQRAERRWLRLLKRLRRAAAPVRDLDVQRELLQSLERSSRAIPEGDGKRASRARVSSKARPKDLSVAPNDEALKVLAPLAPKSLLHREIDSLDRWLEAARNRQARLLEKAIAQNRGKLERRAERFHQALQQGYARERQPRPAGERALQAFARMAGKMPQLHLENLHDFRKGAKKARYIAEANQDDPQARAIGKLLKRMQDKIGDWHDWLVLAEEARTAFRQGDGEGPAELGAGAALLSMLDAERNQRYVETVEVATRLRDQLLGDWHAAPSRRRAAQSSRKRTTRGKNKRSQPA